MLSADSGAVIVSATCLGVSAICLLLAFRITSRTKKTGNTFGTNIKTDGYRDEDGFASAAAIAAFSDRLPRYTILVGALGDLIVFLARIILTTIVQRESVRIGSWLYAIALLLVLGQSALLNRESSSIRRFDIGLLIALQSVSLAIGAAYELYVEKRSIRVPFTIVQILLELLVLAASLSLPRRPEVSRNGKVVDAQFTTTAYFRYSLAWGRNLLEEARIRGSLDYPDLPMLNRASTSASLHGSFRDSLNCNTKGRGLWYVILKAQQRLLLRQWWCTALEGLTAFLPQVCLYKILQHLENRREYEGSVDWELWIWVVALGVSKVANLEFEAWNSWINYGLIRVGSRSQLSAVVFDKSLRMKDIKEIKHSPSTKPSGLASRDERFPGDTDKVTAHILSGFHEEDQEISVCVTDGKKTGAGEDETTSQGPINLLAVDVSRISEILANNYMILKAIVKITVGVTFLVQLIGTWSTLAGLAVALLFQPLNSVLNGHYSKASLNVMNARDEKSHVITEALHGIRQIKISALEDRWQELIMGVREREVLAQRSNYVWGAILTVLWLVMPILFGTVALGVYAWVNGGLIASVAFTALAVFAGLEAALMSVPIFARGLLDGLVSSRRLQEHLDSPDQKDQRIEGLAVTFNNASIAWPADTEQADDTFQLRDITLEFPNEKLSVIHGKTGCGKSLLLAAIVGEADITSGIVTVPSGGPARTISDTDSSNWLIPQAMAFVTQVPWIENATIKANILYDLPFNPERYNKVLHASALDKDLEMLTDGEDTEVGATGINLSGGQKWRLTFARALYSRAGILILDDIFSAVDAHVGRHIFEHGLCGELASGRTRILVSHHIGLVLPQANYAVEIGRDGSVMTVSPDELVKLDSLLDLPNGKRTDQSKVDRSSSNPAMEISEEKKPAPSKFVEAETREQGRVKWKVYKSYMMASGGYVMWALIVSAFAASAAVVLARSYWLRIWSDDTVRQEHLLDNTVMATSRTHLSTFKNSEDNLYSSNQNNTVFYLGIYFAISLSTVVFTALKTCIILVASIYGSRQLFQDMTFTILRAPVRWLDTVPVGRVLNRFVGDFELVDTRLAPEVLWTLHGLFSLTGIIVAGLFISPWILIPVLLLLVTCTSTARIYLLGARDMKRLESNAKSPIFELFGSSLLGLATIRSFGKRDQYVDRMYALLDQYAEASAAITLAVCWMEVRLGLLGILFMVSLACAVVALPSIDPSLAGFALGFAMQYAEIIVDTLLNFTSFELDMNAAERVVEYIDMPTESLKGGDVPAAWPAQGRITFDTLEVAYAPHLPSSLKDISFTVEPHQRIGIVGRTGSGKSTLTLALFRFLEARKGSIHIDGIDISRIRLQHLRSRLTIIPQDPVLFSGTLRSNLDPFAEHTDAAVFDALRRVHLLTPSDEPTDPTATAAPSGSTTPSRAPPNMFHNLSHPIARGGLNFSQGQRQLLCLARALISRPKILVLDEATSSVDMATDALIQRSIREEFTGCTLLVIAHRLSTIADFDGVVVLGEGRVLEMGRPREVWERKGAFWEMVRVSGEREVVEGLLKG